MTGHSAIILVDEIRLKGIEDIQRFSVFPGDIFHLENGDKVARQPPFMPYTFYRPRVLIIRKQILN